VIVRCLNSELTDRCALNGGPAKFPSVQVRFVPKNQLITIPYSELANPSTTVIFKIILKALGVPPEVFVFSLRSRTGSCLIFPSDMSPFNFAPGLVVIPRGDALYNRANFYLQAARRKPRHNCESFRIRFPVVDGEGRLIYLAKLFLTPESYCIGSITQFLRKVHSCDVSAFSVWDLKGPVAESIRPFPLIYNILHERLYIQFSPTAEQWATMRNRVCALEELRNTERGYVKTLEGFEAHVRPIFARIKWVPKDLGENLLSAISMILRIHLQLMSELNALSIDS
jgi:hypothetical protein